MARKLREGRGHRRRPAIRSTALPDAAPFPLGSRAGRRSSTGIGGTGVVTIGAILGMAAHLEGKGCGMIDMAGLAQKGGAVFSHVRIARTPEEIHAIRVVGRQGRSRARLRPGGVGRQEGAGGGARGPHRCSSPTPPRSCPASSPAAADFSLPTERLKQAIRTAAGDEQGAFLRRDAHSPPRCSAIRSAPTCSCSASPFSRRAAAVGRGRRAGDRAERRGGGDEHRGLPLGPPCGARAAISSRPHRQAGSAGQTRAPVARRSMRSSPAASRS